MATIFRRQLTRWVLNGNALTKGTPGAKAHKSKSREWYGLVKGEYVKLSPLRDVAEQILQKRLRESEDAASIDSRRIGRRHSRIISRNSAITLSRLAGPPDTFARRFNASTW